MKRILIIIVVTQFLCTSIWFAGNAVMGDMLKTLHLDPGFLADLTSAVQFGFISGTFLFARLAISDRFSPSLVFFFSSVVAALFNLGMGINGIQATTLLSLRFFTGFFLAGVYPVGMKIASDYYQKDLGKSLGFLVGALTIGTAFPHLLKSITATLPWSYVIYFTSALSVIGGTLLFLLVPDGPHRRTNQQLKIGSFLSTFRNANFRSVALGYFGHMWELYAFWTFLPVMLSALQKRQANTSLNISLLSFSIIASGGLACVVSGMLSQKIKPLKITAIALSLSCLCCILSPLFLLNGSMLIGLLFLFFWGMVVIADSPLFSTLVAQHAPAVLRGTSLTMVNCIGFSITIISIQFINVLMNIFDSQYVYIFLAVGPIVGLLAMKVKSYPLKVIS